MHNTAQKTCYTHKNSIRVGVCFKNKNVLQNMVEFYLAIKKNGMYVCMYVCMYVNVCVDKGHEVRKQTMTGPKTF